MRCTVGHNISMNGKQCVYEKIPTKWVSTGTGSSWMGLVLNWTTCFISKIDYDQIESNHSTQFFLIKCFFKNRIPINFRNVEKLMQKQFSQV